MARWCRLHESIPGNRKLQALSPPLFKWLINFWAFATRNNGVLPSFEDMAWDLHCPVSSVSRAVSQLVEKRFMEQVDECFVPHDWAEHQYESDSSTERVRKFRERKKKPPGNVTGNVTRNVTVTPSEAESREQRQKQRAEAEPLAPSTDDPHTLAERFVDAVRDRHWCLIDRHKDTAEVEKLLATATDPPTQYAALLERHEQHRIWRIEHPEEKRRPPLRYWIRDGDYLQAPVVNGARDGFAERVRERIQRAHK